MTNTAANNLVNLSDRGHLVPVVTCDPLVLLRLSRIAVEVRLDCNRLVRLIQELLLQVNFRIIHQKVRDAND